METPIDAALILWNSDVIDVVSLAMEHRNLRATGIEPYDVEATEDLITSTDAPVVVFDISPPYKTSTRIVRDLLDRFPDRVFVFTCADPVLALRAAQWLSCHPMIQKPYEPDELVKIVEPLVRGVTRDGVKAAVGRATKARVVVATLR